MECGLEKYRTKVSDVYEKSTDSRIIEIINVVFVF